MLPGIFLQSLGVVQIGERKFKLASGEVKLYNTGEAYIEITALHTGATSIVIFGPEDSTPLIGVTMLENLGLQADSSAGSLKPLELLLL